MNTGAVVLRSKEGKVRQSAKRLMAIADKQTHYLTSQLRHLATLLHNSKRGLDLGLSRGFSGSQAAKHLMGLAAANYAGGPGRRRRSSDESS
ncbi:hypothetical protein C0J52_23387 [Blattella germanica]|nr:hypothetical protein C0J52_23387 [Blattella germanica]